MSVNGMDIKNDLNNWLNYFSNAKLSLTVSSQGFIKNLNMEPKKDVAYFDTYKICIKSNASDNQKLNFSKWLLEN